MTLEPESRDPDHVEPNIGAVPNPPKGDSGVTDQDACKVTVGARAKPGAVSSILDDGFSFVRGFCMGAANIVPGVSGGTVALVLGHYQRLIEAISHIDSELIGHVAARRWRTAWEYVDGRFLVGIGAGVVVGSVALAGLMNWLFDTHMPETFAVFFGMILASVLIVRRQVSSWTPGSIVSCAVGIGVALMIGRLSPTDGGDSSIYIFFSAAIAICAMILPGISGAFILLLLGVYHPITGLIKDFAKAEIDATGFFQLSVFIVGCLFGLLAFSRALSWLLAHRRDATMAALVGLMVGSAEKLWPLQSPTPETAELKMKQRVMEIVAPADYDGSLVLLIVLVGLSVTFVLVLERVAGGEESASGGQAT